MLLAGNSDSLKEGCLAAHPCHGGNWCGEIRNVLKCPA